MKMTMEEYKETFVKEIEALQKHRHDADFMLHHGERTEKMILALTFFLELAERVDEEKMNKVIEPVFLHYATDHHMAEKIRKASKYLSHALCLYLKGES